MYLLYGFGISMSSLAEYLHKKKIDFIIHDDSDSCMKKAEKCGYKTSNSINNFTIESLDERFTNIVISPGIHPENPIFLNKIRIWNDVSLFFNFFKPKMVIGVTGTFGKSTTVELIKFILNQNGKTAQVCGNIGIPIFNCDPSFPMVLELSAQQLELCDALDLDIAVILNIYPHHLERYKSLEKYSQAKMNIFNRAKVKIVNSSINSNYITISDSDKSADFFFDGKNFHIKGESVGESLSNLPISEISTIASFAVLKSLNLETEAIINGIKSFIGLPNRTEIISTRLDKVTFVNDSKSTSLLNSIYCLKKFSGKIGWIAGGKLSVQDEEKAMNIYLEILKDLPKLHFVGLLGESKMLMSKCLANKFDVQIFDDLTDCIYTCIEKGCDHIVFSPGHSSFDLYSNFVERGNYFKNKVEEISESLISKVDLCATSE